MNQVKIINVYRKYGLKIVKGYMQYVWDDKGNKYLDCHTNYGVAFLGHCNPKIVKPIVGQLNKLMMIPYSIDNDARDKVLKDLSKILPKKLSYVFFQSTGTEAVEAALKFSRKATKKKKIIAFENAFHGRTMGSLSVTWKPKYREPYQPLIPGVVFVRFNDVEDVDKVVDEETAAVIVEPIQGEGGINVATREFLKALRERTLETGTLLIFDEVQCGFGRTGRIWAFQHYNVEPDILVAGKAVGGGYPVSFVVTCSEVAESLEIGDHGTTYGGNPVACVAVSAAINVLLSENVPEQAATKGDLLSKKLIELIEDMKLNFKVKGLGLMLGVDFGRNTEEEAIRLKDYGVLAVRAGETVLRYLPPYMISKEDVEHIVNALEKLLVEKV